jgi:DNA repair exonuclease SbcCD ATPase subunit
MILFKEIEIQGFGSIINPLRYNLNRKGLNCVLGLNGSGKSSIFSAFTWALYGSTIKGKAEPWKHILPNKFKGTKVVVTFEKNDVTYKVINCHNYKEDIEGYMGGNRMILYIGGKYQKQLRDKNDVKVEVEKILGMSFDLLKNTILFGQKLKRIIQESGPDKKKLFEEAFEASFINEAKALAEEKLIEYKEELNTLNQDRYSYEDKITNLEALIKNIKGSKSETIKQVKILRKSQEELFKRRPNSFKISEDLKLYQIKVKKAEEALLSKKRHSDKLFVLEMEKGKYETEVKMSKSTISEILTELQNVPKNCRTCGSKLDTGKIIITKASIKARYKRKKAEIEKAKEKVKELEKRVSEVTAELDKFKALEDNLKNFKSKLQSLESTGKDIKTYYTYQAQIKSLKAKMKADNDTITLEEKINQHKSKLSEIETKEVKVKKRVDDYTWAISKPLSNSGIKAYIFNELLSSVNKRLLYYSPYIGFKIEFGIDLDSARKDFYAVCIKENAIVDYKELSGGQQQLVDIAIAFSIHDVVNENHKVNILIMDEIFESLDEQNIEIIADLIDFKAQSKSVHLITHTNFNTSKAKVLRLELSKEGRTKAIEF